jgi:hypothetical protein
LLSCPQPARDFTTPTITCWGSRVFNPHDDQLSTKLVARWLPKGGAGDGALGASGGLWNAGWEAQAWCQDIAS